MREAIRGVPDGTYRSEIWNDGMGTPLRYRVRGRGRAATRSTWTSPSAPPQQPRGGSNCTYGYAAAHTVYPLKCMLSPAVPSNAGGYRPFRVTAPEGSTLNCVRPAAVNMRTRTGWYIAPNLFMALAGPRPERSRHSRGCRPPSRSTGRGRTGASTTTICSRAVARVLPRGATASRGSSGRPAPPTRRSSCSRPGRRCWCSRSAIIPGQRRARPAPRRARPGRPRAEAVGDGRPALGGPLPGWRPDAGGRALRGSLGGAVRGMLLDGTGEVVPTTGSEAW